ncbi:MAG: hypothetical protein K0U71_11310 [Actinomycetia bacterium]|nr:hypothetical protein [Actinomycetes bacterium]
MSTATEPAPAPDAPERGLLSAKVSAIIIVLAAIATLVIVLEMLRSTDDEPAPVQSVPAQPNTVPSRVAASANPTTLAPPPEPAVAPTPKPAVAPTPKPAVPAMDDQGFVDSAARCAMPAQAVAIARTTRAAIVICRDVDGTYEYVGTRLRDGASLRLDDVLAIPAGFEARNDGTTYRLSPTEMVVITGEDLLSRDEVLEYRTG